MPMNCEESRDEGMQCVPGNSGRRVARGPGHPIVVKSLAIANSGQAPGASPAVMMRRVGPLHAASSTGECPLTGALGAPSRSRQTKREDILGLSDRRTHELATTRADVPDAAIRQVPRQRCASGAMGGPRRSQGRGSEALSYNVRFQCTKASE